MDTYLVPLWKSEALVRQSVVPSAMVDWRGDLYTMSLYGLSSSAGAHYMLKRYQEKDGTISSKSESIYPWNSIGVSINVTSYPNEVNGGGYQKWFDCYVYNAFHACLAQDVSDNSKGISMIWYVPPTRHMGNAKKEGILYQVRKKDDLSSLVSQLFFQQDTGTSNQYAFHHIKTRNYDASKYAFNVETGNFTAASKPSDPNNLWDCYTQVCYIGLAGEDNRDTGRIFNLNRDCVGSNYNVSGIKVYQRYIKWGDRCYGMCSLDGNGGVRTFYFDVRDGFSAYQGFTVDQNWRWAFSYIDHAEGADVYTPYNYDFCIVKGNNGTGIMCILGLRATGYGASAKEQILNPNYCNRWDYLHTSWNKNVTEGPRDICLMLSSWELGKAIGNYYEEPQNMIYTTAITSGTACNIGCQHYVTYYSDYGSTQLFKNTHKCCVYESSLKNQYIIYCYCYPGKKKHLYLGYAMCWVGSDNKVHLGTKMEFKSPDTGTTWGDSFGEFTSCARIISMDCKNGHLWITWLNATDSSYKYFHILAKDLVGE